VAVSSTPPDVMEKGPKYNNNNNNNNNSSTRTMAYNSAAVVVTVTVAVALLADGGVVVYSYYWRRCFDDKQRRSTTRWPDVRTLQGSANGVVMTTPGRLCCRRPDTTLAGIDCTTLLNAGAAEIPFAVAAKRLFLIATRARTCLCVCVCV